MPGTAGDGLGVLGVAMREDVEHVHAKSSGDGLGLLRCIGVRLSIAVLVAVVGCWHGGEDLRQQFGACLV